MAIAQRTGKVLQALIVDPPNELTFAGPFTEVVARQLRLTNPTDRHMAFKIKTTAPKQYCVRPNSGFIPSNKTVNVAG